jgi:RNA polymerase sigma-70 factor (ECF subfamily)
MQYAADLDLAVACAAGDRDALSKFEVLIERQAHVIARVDRSHDFVKEIQQRLRLRLLIGANDGRPRIRDYAGRGSLAAFVRVAATRLALMEKRTANRAKLASCSVANDALGEPRVEVSDRDRSELEEALRRALASLDSRERAALRMLYFEQRSINDIAAAFGIHRATASRWISHALEHIRGETLLQLREQLGLCAREVAGLVAIVISQGVGSDSVGVNPRDPDL